MGFVGGLVGGLSDLIGNSFLIVLTVVFILFEASVFPAKLAAIARSDDEVSPEESSRIIDSVRHYVAIKTMVSALTGVLITIALLILGVNYAVLWGILAFLLNYVPNIGSIIAAVPAVVLALVDQGLGTALWTAAVFLVVNTVVGNVIEPKVMGRGLGLSTLVVVLSLVFWGWVLGPVGMILSVPLTMTAKIVMESRTDTRWLAVLLGARAPEQSDPERA
jgi:predicted PurR-regulated permease PerM